MVLDSKPTMQVELVYFLISLQELTVSYMLLWLSDWSFLVSWHFTGG